MDFQVYVEDERYSVPTLHLISARTETRALELARELWRNSAHHLGVELRCGDRILFVGGSFAKHADPDAAVNC